jgi:hypothetical protein
VTELASLEEMRDCLAAVSGARLVDTNP